MRKTVVARLAAGALTVGALIIGTGASASAVVDFDPPTVNMDQSTRWTVGSVLSDSSPSATLPVTFTWKQYDESGICGRTAQLYSNGGYTYPTISAAATSFTTNLRMDQYASLRLTSTDCAGNTDSGAYSSSSPSLQQQGVFSLSAGWKSQMCNCWSGGGDVASTKKGASASYRFTAGSVALVGVNGYQRGAGDIYLDGVKVAHVNEYIADRTRGANRVVVWQRQFGKSGTHTLKVVSTTTPKFDIDAVVTDY